nr:MAG TPA: hypothetical protein [Caudoviricetes sp.]
MRFLRGRKVTWIPLYLIVFANNRVSAYLPFIFNFIFSGGSIPPVRIDKVFHEFSLSTFPFYSTALFGLFFITDKKYTSKGGRRCRTKT